RRSTLARWPPDRFRWSTGRARSGSFAEQLVEPAGVMKLEQVVATADMVLADENLRDRSAAVRALDHQVERLATVIHGDFAIFDAPFLEQRLGPPAIGAECLGVDLDGHLSSFTPDT